jgi:hypothetical protein
MCCPHYQFLPRANTLAYFASLSVTKKKKNNNFKHFLNVIKLFFFLKFASKTSAIRRAYPRYELIVKYCHTGKHSSLFCPDISEQRRKKFDNFETWETVDPVVEKRKMQQTPNLSRK